MHNQSATLLGQVLARLVRERGRLRSISAGAGVPYSTLAKLSAGTVTDPRFSTVQALYDYFESHPDVLDSGDAGMTH